MKQNKTPIKNVQIIVLQKRKSEKTNPCKKVDLFGSSKGKEKNVKLIMRKQTETIFLFSLNL